LPKFFSFDLSLSLLVSFCFEPINLFVACCSTNFLLKFLLLGFALLMGWEGHDLPDLNDGLKPLFFCGKKVFFSVLFLEKEGAPLLKEPDIVKVFFLFLFFSM